MPLCPPLRRRAALAPLLTLLALPACDDAPLSPDGAPTPRPQAVVAAAAGASVSVPVQVPASMGGWPFEAPRSLTVPPGFTVSVLARVPGARFLAVAPSGDVLVSNPGAGVVYRVRPGRDGGDATVEPWAGGLRNPHDLVFHTLGGTTFVYVAESHQIGRFVYESDGSAGARQVVVAGLPDNSSGELQGRYGHQLKNIALVGTRLFVSIASPSNADPADLAREPKGGAIYEYDAGGGGGRLFAQGLRNAEGLAFVPGTETLWAAVNNRDNVAYPFHRDFDGDGSDDYGRVIPSYVDDHPPEELTHVRDGGNYGWPFCNPNPDTPNGLDDMPFDRDVENNADGSRLNCDAADRIGKGIQAHSAPLGLTFLQGTNAPIAYRDGVVLAYHGSWNRTQRTGYKVVHFAWDGGAQRPGVETDLITGWAAGGEVWGRPVDVAVAGDGALLVSDDHSGTIYRLAPEAAPPPPATGVGATIVGVQSGRCLEVYGVRQTPGATVNLWACHGGANQRWTLPAPGATGEVRVYGTMCLDAGQGGNGVALTIAACDGRAAQRWAFTSAGELRGADGRCADVYGLRVDDGAPLVAWSCHGGENQRFAAEGRGAASGALVGEQSGRCIDAFGASEVPLAGAPMLLWDCHGGANQRWALPAAGTVGEVRAYGTMCLDAWGAQGNDGDRLVLWPCHGGANQRWTLTPTGEIRGVNGKCVDAWGLGTGNGTELVLWSCHGGVNQRWRAGG